MLITLKETSCPTKFSQWTTWSKVTQIVANHYLKFKGSFDETKNPLDIFSLF